MPGQADTLAGLCLFLSRPLRTSPAICSQSYILRVVFLKNKTKHRDICIEMFYSELLLMECSEAEPGEGAGKLLQRHSGGKGHGSGSRQTRL